MIDITREELIELSVVSDRTKFALSTIRKWIKYGECGVKLEHVKVGREYRTSLEATQRFLARLQGQHIEQSKPAISPHDPHGDLARDRAALLETLSTP